MIVRADVNKDGVRSKAWFDREMIYRYGLVREWADGQIMLWLMLNPSTADEVKNDNTLNRCQTFAKRDGFAGFGVINLFAYRTPYPERMSWVDDPIGPDNDSMIVDLATRPTTGVVVAGWGTHKAAAHRGPQVTQTLTNLGVDLDCLGLTKSGLPRHPLYLPSASERIPYRRC